MADEARGRSRPLPGLTAGIVSAAAVVVFTLVARHLDSVPSTNEPENLGSAFHHVAVMAVLVIITLVAAIVAIVRGSCGGGSRGVIRAVPILLGLFGLVAAAICCLAILGAALATRDV